MLLKVRSIIIMTMGVGGDMIVCFQNYGFIFYHNDYVSCEDYEFYVNCGYCWAWRMLNEYYLF